MIRSRLRARIVELEAYIEPSTIRRVLAVRCPRGWERARAEELALAVAELERELGRRMSAERWPRNGARR